MTRISQVAKDDSEISKEERNKILQEFHEQPVGGHSGMNGTYERVRLYTSWSGMKQAIEDYIRQCDVCL